MSHRPAAAGGRRFGSVARAAGPRVVGYAVLAALAIAAAMRRVAPTTLAAPFAPPAESLLTLPPLEIGDADAGSTRADTLRAGESLVDLLERGGWADSAAVAALDALGPGTLRRLRPGAAVALRRAGGDSLASEIVVALSSDEQLRLTRAHGAWRAERVQVPWRTDTVVVSGVIESTLSGALAAAGGGLPQRARAELAWSLADIFEYRVDMSRDLQEGDSVRALVVRSTAPDGRTRLGAVLAARLALSGTPLEAIRFESAGARPEYFDQNGKSLRLAFLRAPLAFRRISSGFGMRMHPILGIWRQHAGTDYAAAAGTPVRTVGDGIVIFAGRRGGYGNSVDVRHRNGYVSRYGHMRAFARGLRVGTHVSIGQTIGYVGMTGLATAPHLHFEVLVGGVQRDPRRALSLKSGLPVPASERRRFESVRTGLLAALDRRQPQGVALRTD